MNKWTHLTENGQDFWVNEKIGNIVKASDTSAGTDYFVAMIPKVVKLGPFETLEEAKQAAEQNVERLQEWARQFNEAYMGFLDEIKGE